MIGSALKKLAKENGMTVSGGFAYGSFCGYDSVFFEGGGWKAAVIYGYQPDEERCAELAARLGGDEIKKQYRLSKFTVSADRIELMFADTIGTMKKMLAFFDWFMPILPGYGVMGSDVCPLCGQPMSSYDSWKLYNGMPMRTHSGCMELNVQKQEQAQDRAWEEEQDDPEKGFGKGLIGAVLGALLGAVIWAAIFMLGYVSALGGLVIVFFARKGYDLFKGKKGRAAVFALAVISVLGVLAGMALGYIGEIAVLIMKENIPGVGIEYTFTLLQAMMEEPQLIAEMVRNTLMGLLFAVIGSFVLFRDMWKSNTKQKFSIKDMK